MEFKQCWDYLPFLNFIKYADTIFFVDNFVWQECLGGSMSKIVPEYDKFLQQTLRSQVFRESSFSLSLYGFLVFNSEALCFVLLVLHHLDTFICLSCSGLVIIAAASNLIEAGN
jgi:hypothetical protein